MNFKTSLVITPSLRVIKTQYVRKLICDFAYQQGFAGLGLQLYKKETLAQVFSSEFHKIFKKAFFTEHLWVSASGNLTISANIKISQELENVFPGFLEK